MTKAYKAGAFATDTPSDIITLVGLSSAAAHYQTFLKVTGSAALASYQVPTGKTFFATKIIYTPTTINSDISIGYADTSVTDSASAPTNPVTQFPNGVILGPTVNTKVEYDIHSPLAPAEKFPYFKNDAGTGTVLILGYEA